MPRKKNKEKEPLADFPLGPVLSAARVTPKSLADGAYQRKLTSHFAPELLPKALNSLRRAVDDGAPWAVREILELYELIQRKSAVSIINNDNRQVNVDARTADGEKGARRSFERIARGLAELSEHRPVGSGLTLDIAAAQPTPEGISK